jgi:hypothetical protein
MASHQIAVTVDAGSIQVEPETLVMTSLDDVQWAGKNARKFSIEFEGAGPFTLRKLPHADATTKQRPRSKGRFKYTVVSADDPTLKLDPVVVVEEPETGPHP